MVGIKFSLPCQNAMFAMLYHKISYAIHFIRNNVTFRFSFLFATDNFFLLTFPPTFMDKRALFFGIYDISGRPPDSDVPSNASEKRP